MCDDVIIHANQRCEATNQGELAARLGEFVRENGYADNAYRNDMCLCPVDLVATAKMHGYVAIKTDPATGEYDPFNTHFVKGVDNA